MDHQPDVQEQQQSQHVHHQQQLPNSANIVYIQQDYQTRGQDSGFATGNDANLNFQQQNANFGQFENHYTYLGNGNFPPSNSSTALIPGLYGNGKSKNVSFRRNQFGNDQDGTKFHPGDCVQYGGGVGNYPGSNDLQRISYQQPPSYFLAQNPQYPLTDMLVPTCQSSGSSEASDDSSISQQNYSNDGHLEFTVPVPFGHPRQYNQYQQKEYPENYIVHQENQIPRCDSSKSETTESTCSSLSSIESQSEDNSVRLIVSNPTTNAFDPNTQNSINQNYRNQINEVIDQRNCKSVKCDDKNLLVVFPNRNGGGTHQKAMPVSQSGKSQKIFGLINLQNQSATSQDKIAVPVQMIKLNDRYGKGDGKDNSTSQQTMQQPMQNTSDSSVINTNYLQKNDCKENDCAMLIKETSDKCISQCGSDVNSSMINSNNVYLVKSNQGDLVKTGNCFGDSSSNTCLNNGNGNNNNNNISVNNNASHCPTNPLPVPIGWRRLLMDGSIVYLSPSNAVLRSIEQVKMYLQTMGTCKCGLECPVNCDSVFNFNPKVVSRPWDSSDSELTRLCNHKRKAPCPSNLKEGVPDKSIKLDRKEITQLKKKKKKHGNGYSGVSVSQLLAQRDRALAAASRWPMQNGNYQPQQQPNQFQVMRNQDQVHYDNNMQMDQFKQEGDKSFAGVVNINGQIVNENNSGLMRTGQMNFAVANQNPQETGMGQPMNYNPPGQEFPQNHGPRPEGVMMTPQGLLFPPNMLMHRPRSIPPWHQGKFAIKPKQQQQPLPQPQPPVLYERIPSLHQHMPPPPVLCEDFASRKKHKPKTKKAQQESARNQPSFMEDPNAYLAQQTALLHSTISRPNFNINTENQNSSDGQFSSVPVPSNVLLPPKNTFSARPQRGSEFTQTNPENSFGNHVCSNLNCNDCPAYGNRNFNQKKSCDGAYYGKYNEWRRSEDAEDNPVTSSTEKMATGSQQRAVTDSRPIQGGAISTSNGSPQPQSQGSPCFRQDESPKSELTSLPSRSPVTGNVLISSSTQSPFAVPGYQREEKGDSSPNNRSFEGFHQPCESPKSGRPVSTSDHDTKTVTSSLTKEETGEAKGNRLVRTMASGHTVSSNTITSVLAGKAQTATVTVNNNPTVPPTISLLNLANQNVVMAQKPNPKSPLEMVQSVVSSIQSNNEVPNVVSVNKAVMPASNVLNSVLTTTSNINPILANATGTAPVVKANGSLPAGHIIVSNNGQYIVASNGIPQANISGLKLNQASAMPPMSTSPVVTNATASVTQVLPAVQQVLGQPTVLVNALPAPFVIQPGVMAVDTGIGHLAVATGNVLQSSLIENDALRTNNIRGLLSPDKTKSKKGSKKRKNQVASIVQMTSPNNMIINQPFNQQNFAVSPGGSIQALTLVSSKHGGPAQIVMNNQNNFNQFGSQPQQINLLQPVNLASVPNFPAFQQFIVPGLGNMVMASDGTTTILPDANLGVQLQLQNVNGQNVLTPVQNTGFINGQGILTTPAGMLIRAPNQQKVIQSNSNPQFLSPSNGQFLVNQFQGQLSPLIATNLSPNQQIYTNSPPRQSPQDFIQIIPTSSAQNTTVVQQNTTIVQQQTTMVSNNQNFANPKSNFILNNSALEKPIELQIVANQRSQENKVDVGSQHSVSTQTSANKEASNLMIATSNTFCQTVGSSWNGSPPDTTTHSPVGSESNRERVQSPPDSRPAASDCLPQAMVQYVSSSINESEGESDTYLLPGFPNLLNKYDGLRQGEDKKKNMVESSTLLQESGIQIQLDRNYLTPRCQKTSTDESVVSSHSDLNIQDKQIESQCGKHSEVALPESRSDDFDSEGKNIEKDSLKEGDLVWGSVRGSSAWPGKLVGPISEDGRVLVRWFGGHISSPTRVNINQLQSLSQGLEAHHKASNKGRKNRKLNIELEAAIQEAMLELDKKATQEKKLSTGSGRSRRAHR